MTIAYCFSCGAQKASSVVSCGSCRKSPATEADLVKSLILSDDFSTQGQLAHFANEVRSNHCLTAPDSLVAKAREAARAPKYQRVLTATQPPRAAPQSAASPVEHSRVVSASPPILRIPAPRLTTTVLHQSPFSVLGVTTRDNRKRIVELAEEKSLELDHDVCQKARSDLTNPRTRLGVEIAWLPGVSPRKASQLVENLVSDPMAIRKESGLPALAHLNLLASAFEAVDGTHDADDLTGFIMEAAYLAEELTPEEVLRDINEDRAVSGFPEVRALDQIESELTERKRFYRGAIKDALDRLPPMTLIQVMTETVDGVTSGGENHAPGLIDDLVDSYEVETQSILQKEAENVYKLIKAARDHTVSGETAIKPYVDKLDAVARNWDKIAQPIQLSTKARGIDHEASRNLAYEIRSLAIDLFNKHDMLVQSQRLTKLIQEIFSEVPEIAARAEQDADALADILQQRKRAASREVEWAREISYHAEIGVMFKDPLSISPDGVSWKGQNFPLDSITRVRWGGTSHSINGIPTGTTYTIAFGNRNSEALVELKKKDVYNTFTEKLWRAVCVRLLTEMLEALRDGRDLHFGDALLHDDGITLVRRKFLGSNENVRCSWGQVHVWSADGSFCIGDREDKKVNAAISYIHGANTHVLEQAIRMGFKKPGMRRLSEILN
ncbi:MAG: hypothetical protein KKC79_05745 [Gammaproteobacteria bacterium]|nr:hypothetical protein [Gammaproteobacteria bacterium]MBU1441463.1 hypothetical protein [Gammaproteobacteria bacterium]MBU2287290.1 hypothetical protein [Gammaproteobacteria bacterium]MBU2408138.1 hypothetical protein [Gammaproteobacteria bacterium]